MSDDELKNFVSDAIAQMAGQPPAAASTAAEVDRLAAGHGFRQPALAEEPTLDDDQSEDGYEGAEDAAYEAPDEPFDQADLTVGREAAEAWASSLSEDMRLAVLDDPDLAADTYRSWLASQTDGETAEKLFAPWAAGAYVDDDADAAAVEPNEFGTWAERAAYTDAFLAVGQPFPARELAASILSDPGAHGYESLEQAEGALIFSATASPEEWIAWCREFGIDPETVRPGRGDLPRYLEMRILAANLKARAEQLTPDGRKRYL